MPDSGWNMENDRDAVSNLKWSMRSPPQAITQDGVVHLYLLAPKKGIALYGSLPALAAPPSGGDASATGHPVKQNEFDFIKTEDRISAFALTEDGEWLVLAHRDSNKLSIWNVRKSAVDRTIDCGAPSAVLCRGDEVFAANDGLGTVTVLSQRNWSTVRTLQVGYPKIESMSAAGGKYFDGKLLVMADSPNDDPGYHRAVQLNSTSGRSIEIRQQYCGYHVVELQQRLCSDAIGSILRSRGSVTDYGIGFPEK